MNYISIWINTDLESGFAVVIDTEDRGRRHYGNVTWASVHRLRKLATRLRREQVGTCRPFYAKDCFGWTLEW